MLNKKAIPILAVTISASLFLGACSSEKIEEMKETVVGELENVVEEENNPGHNKLPVVDVDNVDNENMDIVDNANNRQIAALTMQEMLNDIASFKVEEETELLEVEKHLGTYADLEVQTVTTESNFKEKTDTEELIDRLVSPQKEQLLELLARYAPKEGISNYEKLNDTQKIVVLNYLGNRKTEFNYQYMLHKVDNPTEYTVDPEKILFRENDIIVFPNAISHNHNDVNFVTEDYLPYLIIVQDGKYVVDIFNTALMSSSPISIDAALATKDTEWESLVDKTLTKQWTD